jgi:hypothetical protein
MLFGVTILMSMGTLYYQTYLRNKLNKNYRFTIAVVTDFISLSDGPREAECTYSINNKSYKTTFSLTMGYENKFKIGSRLFIKFAPKVPEFVEVDYDKFVPDKLEPPLNGWKEIPHL